MDTETQKYSPKKSYQITQHKREVTMKKKLYKILMSSLAYIVFTTLFAIQFLNCSAQVEQHNAVPYPVFHPSYAALAEYGAY